MTERFAHPLERRRVAQRGPHALNPWRWASAHSALPLVLVALACGGSPERPPPSESEADIALTDLVQYDATAADARDVYATGACEDGATRVCRVYLPSHNDVQPCFVGEQLCGGAQWGECESGVLVDANAEDSEIDPDTLP